MIIDLIIGEISARSRITSHISKTPNSGYSPAAQHGDDEIRQPDLSLLGDRYTRQEQRDHLSAA
jgi:hypothetical protein